MQKMINTASLTSLVFLCALLLSSCGFHLRGQSPDGSSSTLKQINIVSAKHLQAMNKALTQQAVLQGITNSDAADWKINLQKEELDNIRVSSTQSVSSDQFRLKLRVTYQITYLQQDLIVQSMTRQALFQNNEDQALSKVLDKEQIYQSLREELAQAILQQLTSLSLNPPDCDCDEAKTSAAQ